MIDGYKLSPKHQSPIKKHDNTFVENNMFFSLIHQILSIDNHDDESLIGIKEKLEQITIDDIKDNIPHNIVCLIFEKYQNSKSFYDYCLGILIGYLSYFDDYLNVFIELNMVQLLFNKIQNMAPSIIFSMKALSNVFDILEDKTQSLEQLCSLVPNLLKFQNNEIFDYFFQFILNYVDSNSSTCYGIQITVNTISSLISIKMQNKFEVTQNKEKANTETSVFTCFSYIRMFWAISKILDNNTVNIDLMPLINNHLFKQKKIFLFYHTDFELPKSYLNLAGKILLRYKENPFDIHIFDLIPLICSNEAELCPISIWMISIMINSSYDFVKEFSQIDMSIFESAFLKSNFNTKLEIAYLYQYVLDQMSFDDQLIFFSQFPSIFQQFLELDNVELTCHLVQIICDISNFILSSKPEQIEGFIKKLIDNEILSSLNDIITDFENNTCKYENLKIDVSIISHLLTMVNNSSSG